MRLFTTTYLKSACMAFLCLWVFSFSLQAQEVMSLRECIDFARENSLTLKQATYAVDIATLNDRRNRLARLPSVNGTATNGVQFGRTIDPTTNEFNTERINFGSYRLDASVPLYNGGSINHTITQGDYDLKASVADVDVAFNNTALNIANAYLQILMAEEQLKNANQRKSLSEAQLEQTDKLIRAGSLPENDRLDVLAQVARDEQAIIQAQNLIDINYLNLKEFMQMDPGKEIKVEQPPAGIFEEIMPERFGFQQVYGTALGTQPQISRDEFRLKSAEMDVMIARAAKLPSLFLFGGLDTRWSSAARTLEKFNTQRLSQTFYFDNMPVDVEFDTDVPVFEDTPFFTQIDENFGQSFGLSLNIPIYNNGRNNINMQIAQVGIMNARLQSDLTKQQLKIDVQNAIASARASWRTYEAALKTREAALAAFGNAEKQYELGVINTFQYTTARNNLDVAENDVTVAKYEYLFRIKIIDFYLGRELSLN